MFNLCLLMSNEDDDDDDDDDEFKLKTKQSFINKIPTTKKKQKWNTYLLAMNTRVVLFARFEKLSMIWPFCHLAEYLLMLD